MDRQLAASLDRWLTTPPEDGEECDCEEDECTCDEEENAEIIAAEEAAQAEYESAMCKCGHERFHHGEVCLGITCRCSDFNEAGK